MDLSFALFAVLAFLAVVLGLEGLYNVWMNKHGAEAKRIGERLAALRGELHTEVSLERVQERQRMGALQAWIDATSHGSRLSHWVRASGLQVGAAELVAWSLVLAIAGFALPRLLGLAPIFGATLAIVLGLLPWWRVASVRGKRVARIELQLPEALDLMCRALRAGHSFPTAIRMVGTEMSEPLGKDFRILADEVNYGVPMGEALANFADRVPLADVRYFVVAVMIQRESGGNLAELLENISAIVRARLKLMGEIRTLSAEGKLSAIILTALPFGVAAVVNLVNPKFMSVLWTDPAGLRMVGLALFMMVVGILWMRSIIRIRV